MTDHASPFEAFRGGGSLKISASQIKEKPEAVAQPVRGPVRGRGVQAQVPDARIETEADESLSPFDRFTQGLPAQAGEAREAFGRGLASGVARGAPLAPGAFAGGRLGALGFAGGPVVGTATTILGTLLGLGTAYFAGEAINESLVERELSIRDLEELPPRLRGVGAVGQTFGGALTIGLSPIGLAKLGFRFGPSKVGNYLNRILDFAGKNPARFTLREVQASAVAAGAGGVAVEAFPDQPGIRLGAEVVGGAYHQLLFNGTKAAAKGIFSIVGKFRDAGRQSRAGQILQDYMVKSGEDPEIFANLVAQLDFPGVETTVAQKIGSKAAAHFEAELAEQMRTFAEPARRMAKDSLKALTNMLVLLRGTGDPAALREVAAIRYRFFKTFFQNRINRATDEAIAAAEKITTDTPGARSELSRQAEQVIGKSLEGSRAVERKVWKDVAHNVSLEAKKVLAGWDRLLGQILPRKVAELPAVITNTMFDIQSAVDVLATVVRTGGREVNPEEVKAAAKTLTTGFFIKLRDELLSQVRQLDRQKFPNERRLLGEMAEDVLEAIDDGFEAAPGLSSASREAYNVARDYSHALNEVYTRTFVGAARSTTATGARRIPPELLLRESLATGKELGALRLRELKEAVAFLGKQAMNPGVRGQVQVSFEEMGRNFELMLDIQGRLLRLAASESIEGTGPRAGRVSAKQLAKFISDNEEIFNELPPKIREDLLAALKTEEGLRAVERATPLRTARTGEVTLSANMEREAAFARILRVESVPKAVEGALASDTPLRYLVRMARLARRGGDAPTQALRGAIWDDAIRRASDFEGNISLRELSAALTQPIAPGFPSLLQYMQAERLMTLTEIGQVRQLINRARAIGEALETRPVGEALFGGDITDVPEMFLDTALRVAGAQTGRQVALLTGGGTVQTPGMGASLAKRVFSRLPKFRVKEILKDAFLGAPLEPGGKPYSLLISLLDRPDTPTAAFEKARQIHAYAFMAGYTYLSDEDNFLLQVSPEAQAAEPPGVSPEDETADEAAEQALRSLPAEFEQSQTENAITDNVVAAVAQVESGEDVAAVGGVGELGQFQIRPEVAANPGFDIPSLDLKTATEEEQAAWVQTYLQVALARFGTLELALAAYNAGIPTVDKIKGDITKLPKSTQQYLDKYRKLGILSSVLPEGEAT